MNRQHVVERYNWYRRAEKDCQNGAAIDLGIAAVFGYIEYRTPGAVIPAIILAGALIEGGVNIARSRSNALSAAAIEGALAAHDLSTTSNSPIEAPFVGFEQLES